MPTSFLWGNCQLDDLDQVEFSRYFERSYGKPVSSVGIPFEQLLQNLNLARPGTPNLKHLDARRKWHPYPRNRQGQGRCNMPKRCSMCRFGLIHLFT